MSRKFALVMSLTLVLIRMFGVALKVQVVGASGTVFIKADGSVVPDTAPISSDDNVTYTLTDNIYDGIVVEKDNIVVDGAGCTLQFSGTGIDLAGRYNVTVKNIEIKAFDLGIHLKYSSYNTISGNNITNNDCGIWLYEYSNNKFYHNNFIDNTQQVCIYTSGYANVWDDGYPSGGNYWSDHNPPDLDGDGIGDTPYDIDENNTDRYPLIHPYGFVPSPDLNDDKIVDIDDLIIWTNVWGSQPGYLNWNPYVDLNQDGIVDIFDLVIIAVNYGKAW